MDFKLNALPIERLAVIQFAADDGDETIKINIMREYEMKQEISEAFDQVSFRKFAHAFRKAIAPWFSRENNLKSNGGCVDANFTFEEHASYVIGDGSYSVTKEEFDNFMKIIKKYLENDSTKRV